MKKIDFFIVGAPKSATSFIKHYLNKNPKIFMPEIEPVFWCKDMNDLSELKSFDEYINIFGNNLFTNERVCGEKTSIYLFSDKAFEEIFNYNKNSKIIICLRNPIKAVVSYHNHNKIMGFETINDFLEAWNAQIKRKNSNFNIPYYARKEILRYQYKYIYSYDIHVKKFIEKFGREKIKIIFHEDITSNPQAVIDDLFNFLNVNKINFKKFETVNKQPRINIKKNLRNEIFKFVILFLKKDKVKKISIKIKNILGIKSFGFLNTPFKNKFKKLHTHEDKNINDVENIEIFLRKEFEESIKNLSRLTSKNLDHWLA